MAPGNFIPMLERTGMINDVGRWALRQAVEVYRGWCDARLAAVPIAVNVSRCNCTISNSSRTSDAWSEATRERRAAWSWRSLKTSSWKMSGTPSIP